MVEPANLTISLRLIFTLACHDPPIRATRDGRQPPARADENDDYRLQAGSNPAQAVDSLHSTKNGGNGGTIVNISSAAARIGSPGEYVDYAASKGAIDSLTRGLSTEVAGEGIRVNCVRPGFIYTDMHADGGEPDRIDRLADSIPLKRGGTPKEVARSICWLLSDEASYVTGTFIDVAAGK